MIVGVFMLLLGAGIAGVWTRDIVRGDQIDIRQGLLRARNPDDGSLMLPHWIAEYGTAGALIAGAVGLLTDAGWGRSLSLIALGALVYTSTNSLGWAFATSERRPYAVPMLVGALGGLTAIVALVV